MTTGDQTRGGPHQHDITQCRTCSTDVVFVRTKKNKRMPVNVVPTDPKYRAPYAAEYHYAHGEHQSHFATCEHADDWRKK